MITRFFYKTQSISDIIVWKRISYQLQFQNAILTKTYNFVFCKIMYKYNLNRNPKVG